MRNKIDVYIPARLDSSRLPKKHLKKINGIPAILQLINRLKNCKKIDQIIVTTTGETIDDELIKILDKEKILYFRGDKNNMIKRFLDAATKFESDIIIDVEGDKIYTEPNYVDMIAEIMDVNKEYDMVIGNDSEEQFNTSHYIHGFIPAGIRRSALEKISKLKISENNETGYREYFLSNEFKTRFIVEKKNRFSKNARFTLDYEEDLRLAKTIFQKLKADFTIEDIEKLFRENPKLFDVVDGINEVWQKNYERKRVNLGTK